MVPNALIYCCYGEYRANKAPKEMEQCGHTEIWKSFDGDQIPKWGQYTRRVILSGYHLINFPTYIRRYSFMHQHGFSSFKLFILSLSVLVSTCFLHTVFLFWAECWANLLQKISLPAQQLCIVLSCRICLLNIQPELILIIIKCLQLCSYLIWKRICSRTRTLDTERLRPFLGVQSSFWACVLQPHNAFPAV